MLLSGGTIAHLEDDLGEDIYKNWICILTSCQDIIADVIKVQIDDRIFMIRIKEAPGWILSITSEFPKTTSKNREIHGPFEEDDEINPMQDKDDISEDPFGIYDTMKNLEKDERNLDVNGYKDGEIKNNTLEGHNGNFSSQNPNSNNFDELYDANVSCVPPPITAPDVAKACAFMKIPAPAAFPATVVDVVDSTFVAAGHVNSSASVHSTSSHTGGQKT